MNTKLEALRVAYEAATRGIPSAKRKLVTAAVAAGMSPNNPDPLRWASGKLTKALKAKAEEGAL